MNIVHVPQRAETAVRVPLARHSWMDNLRVAVIVGVIITHVATAYVLDSDWYYEERTAHAVTEAVVASAILPAALFGMAALFLVAGWLAHRSLVRKGSGRFVLGRLTRLGVPLVIFTTLVGPLTSVVGGWAEGEPGSGDLGSMFIGEVRDLDTGPTWFLAALLVFSMAYAGWRRGHPIRTSPTQLRARHLALAAAAIILGSFVVRLAWGVESDTPFGLNLWEWPQMATMFAFGVVAGERHWLEPLPVWIAPSCGRATVAGLVGLVGLAAIAGLTGDTEAFAGGWHVQALAAATVEATIAVAASLWAVTWFIRRWNTGGPAAGLLGRASFAAYLAHAPVVVLLSAALSSVEVVAEVKFGMVAVVGVVVSFSLGWLATRRRRADRLP